MVSDKSAVVVCVLAGLPALAGGCGSAGAPPDSVPVAETVGVTLAGAFDVRAA